MRNPSAVHPATLPNRKSPWQTGTEEQAARREGTEAQLQVLRALLPGIFARFARDDRVSACKHDGALARPSPPRGPLPPSAANPADPLTSAAWTTTQRSPTRRPKPRRFVFAERPSLSCFRSVLAHARTPTHVCRHAAPAARRALNAVTHGRASALLDGTDTCSHKPRMLSFIFLLYLNSTRTWYTTTAKRWKGLRTMVTSTTPILVAVPRRAVGGLPRGIPPRITTLRCASH